MDSLSAVAAGLIAEADVDYAAVLVLSRALTPDLDKRFNPFQRRGPDGKWSGGGDGERKKKKKRSTTAQVLMGVGVGTAAAVAHAAILVADLNSQNQKIEDLLRWQAADTAWQAAQRRDPSSAGPRPPRPDPPRPAKSQRGTANVAGRRTKVQYGPMGSFSSDRVITPNGPVDRTSHR